MYKHVEKHDYPQPKVVCEFVCAPWILKDSAHCYRQLKCSLVCAVWLPLNKHAHNPPAHRQRNDGEETLYLQNWGSNTTQPHRGGWWPLLQQHRLSLFSWHSITTPPPPSLFISSSIISLILKHLITLFHPSLSPESFALSSVQTIHSFLFRTCLTVRASFHLSISHISVTAIIPHVGEKEIGGVFYQKVSQ